MQYTKILITNIFKKILPPLFKMFYQANTDEINI